MKNLRRKFNRFCFQNRDKGIPNLMLYISLGAALVYLFTQFAGNPTLYAFLCFDKALILKGQVWRLLTFPLVYDAGNILFTFITLVCYYSLGRALENIWGTFRFNLFYLSGMVMMDAFCLIFGGRANVTYLNLSLFLAYATLYPDARFLLMYVIPVKAWVFALFYLVYTIYSVVLLTVGGYFPFSLFPLVAIANYLLFFGSDVKNVIPVSWRLNLSRLLRRGKQKITPKDKPSPKVVPFPNAGSYEATVAKPQTPYTHRCTVCGKTDVDNPDLEFRYCSRCKGYYCYCIEHINNHSHVE